MGTRHCCHTHGIGARYNCDVEQEDRHQKQHSIYKHNQPTARVVCTMPPPPGEVGGKGNLRSFCVLFPDLSVGYTENSLIQLYAFDVVLFSLYVILNHRSLLTKYPCGKDTHDHRVAR